MVINELKEKQITVTLDYNECRDISNGLYYATKNELKGAEYQKIFSKCKFLFDMVKHGYIQPETVKEMINVDKASD